MYTTRNMNSQRNEKKYAVIRFEDGTISEIPTKWLFENNAKCWWPPTKNVSNHMAKETIPAENWKMFPIQVETFCDSLEIARKKADDIDFTESEQVATGRGQRRKKHGRTVYNEHDSSDTDKETRTLDPPPRLNTIISISSADDRSSSPVPSVLQQIDNSVDSVSNKGEKISEKANRTGNKHATTSKIDSLASTKPCCQSATGILEEILTAVSKMQLQLDDLGQLIASNKQPTDVDAFEPIKRFLPLQNIEALNQFNEHITDQVNGKLFGNYITMIGGNGLKDAISRAYNNTFTNELAVACSWLGLRNNHRVSDTKTICAIKDILLSRFATSNNTCSVKDFEVISSEWFRHAKQRLNRRKQ